ncbi:MAG: hydroxymethylpyrimidine kinase / phosphomethylpyrimidine kinase / thiamine-phosphate diphosphorylase, partial [Candidatus Eremiobacteraeota bacterium]|nr:hydroxymethylpyrimidine kinase / phosphomethylpyrimidine kinase / thiamine-phosphate diphosphorylase [Candidatus Eremiobacteraeota bacterium]
MTVVATVGTTHPLAFAGLTFAMLALEADAVRPVCVIAGVTAQDADRVRASIAVDAATIHAQFDALRAAGVGAFHVGALVSADAVRAVAAGLASYPNVPVVVDPVLAASGGDALADDATRVALRDTLFARASLITPNLDEASGFLGRRIAGADAMRAAATALLAFGSSAVLVKGGHLSGDAIDVLADDATRIALRDTLFARATLITPNLEEAGAFLGRRIADVASMHGAASEMLAFGAP